MSVIGSYANGFAPRDGQPLYPELWRGCVGAWAPCLGPTGLTLRDWSEYKNHGTLTNMDPGSDWVINAGRNAIDFDGVNDHVPTRVMSSTNDFTISAWFSSRDVTSFRAIVSDANSAGTVMNRHMEISSAGKLGVLWGLNPYLRVGGATSLTANRVYHGAIVRSGASGAWTYQIYLDGRLDGSGTSAINPGNASITTIGRAGEANAQYFNGNVIDDVRVYGRALNVDEIKLLSLRRGIAYDLAPSKRTRTFAGGFKAYWAARKAQILGGGV